MKLPKTFTEEKISLLRNLYSTKSKKEIMHYFPEYKWRSLQNIANFLKIKKEYSELSKGNFDKLFNNSLFTYYIYGLILSDGNINLDGTLKIELCIKDKNYLEKISDYLELELKEYPVYNNSKPGAKGTCRIKIKNIKKGIHLRNFLGIKNSKTYEGFELSFIKGKYQMLSFLAGFIDGDGTISNNGICHIDSHKNLEFLFKEIGDLLIKYEIVKKYSINKYKDMVRISFTKEDIYYIKCLLIKFNIPIMKRKWDKVNYFKNKDFLIYLKSTIKILRKKKYKLNQICKIIKYKHVGSLYNFCKLHSI
jgi:hypothetical protein